MKRFVEGTNRTQGTLFPEYLDDWVDENNPVQVIDAFVEELDLGELGFEGVTPEITGRPSYHPSVLLKLYIYGYLNRVQSSRRLEREASRNVELMWLTGRLVPDHKTIAVFRKTPAGSELLGDGAVARAGDLIRLTMTHFAQHGEDPGAQRRQVIQIFTIDAADPEPVALGGSSISDTDGHGRAKNYLLRKRHGPDSSLARSVRAVLSCLLEK